MNAATPSRSSSLLGWLCLVGGLGLALWLGARGWDQHQALQPRADFLRETASRLVADYNAAHGTSVSVPGISFVSNLGGHPAQLVYGGIVYEREVALRATDEDMLRHLTHELSHHTLNARLGAFHDDHGDDGSEAFRETLAEYRRLAGIQP